MNEEALRNGELGLPIGVFFGRADAKADQSRSGSATAPTKAQRSYQSSEEEYIGAGKNEGRSSGLLRTRGPRRKSPHRSLPHLGAVQQRSLLGGNDVEEPQKRSSARGYEDGKGSLGATEEEYDSGNSEHVEADESGVPAPK